MAVFAAFNAGRPPDSRILASKTLQVTKVSEFSPKALFLKALSAICLKAGLLPQPEHTDSNDWCHQRCRRSACAIRLVERTVIPRQAVRQPDGDRRSGDAGLWRHSPEQ